jgi:hypothetical protein
MIVSSGDGVGQEEICMTGMSAAFRNHGTYIYSTSATIADYGSIELTLASMKRAGMVHAWVRIHGQRAYGASEKKVIAAFINAAKAAGISIAGWGWCQGDNASRNASLALNELAYFGLTDYVADIEHGTNNAKWSEKKIVAFCTQVRSGVTSTDSSFPTRR